VKNPSALRWLLEPRDSAVRFHALVDILHRPLDSDDVTITRKEIPNYLPVRKLMKAQTSSGVWRPSDTCYRPKWASAVWPLMLLAEMGVPPNARIKAECERFFDLHQVDTGAFACPSKLEDKGRRWDEACLTGNMVRTLSKFGYGNDPRIQRAIDWFPKHQQEDGGWNCDYPEKKVKHSSFMSTVEPLWAYSEIPRRRWTRRMKSSIERGAEFLLMHRVYKSDNHHWKPTYPFFTQLHFPMYYFYDILHGLRVLTKLGYSDDERIREAVHLLMSKQNPDGTWNLEGDWYREGDFFYPSGKGRKTLVDVEEIGKPSKWITLTCYRVLGQTGDLELPEDF